VRHYHLGECRASTGGDSYAGKNIGNKRVRWHATGLVLENDLSHLEKCVSMQVNFWRKHEQEREMRIVVELFSAARSRKDEEELLNKPS
jgi:hypothetical protein